MNPPNKCPKRERHDPGFPSAPRTYYLGTGALKEALGLGTTISVLAGLGLRPLPTAYKKHSAELLSVCELAGKVRTLGLCRVDPICYKGAPASYKVLVPNI